MTRKNLTNLELEVMRALWAADPGPPTVREVAEKVNEARRAPLAYTTVQTVLRILRDKGALRVRAGDGRAHTYVAALSRDEVTSSMLGDLVDRLCDGSAQPLLTRLIEHESLTRDELADLRRLIDRQLGGEVAP